MSLQQNIANKWDPYLKYGERQFFRKRTIIYEQDTCGEGFYYIYKGIIKILINTPKGNERLLNIVFPGNIVGIQAMDRQPYITTAVTAKDSVLYFFSCQQVVELLRNETDSRELIAETVIRNTDVLIKQIYLDTMSSGQQASSVLLSFYKELKQNAFHLTQSDLTNYTGLNRITVYKVLKEWERQGIIAMGKRKLEVKRPDLLENYIAEC